MMRTQRAEATSENLNSSEADHNNKYNREKFESEFESRSIPGAGDIKAPHAGAYVVLMNHSMLHLNCFVLNHSVNDNAVYS